mgnify:CR=1 FL=1
MKKAIFYLLACALLPVAASADEGMWLVSTFRDVIYPQMKKEGLKLKPGEIYNEESPALCNAIVAVDGGMGTGSVISDKGLVITNHHVAYGDIHSLSTPAKNYLEEGFWALRQKDELPLKGKTVTFLRQVRDVTDEALAIRDSLEKANSLGVFGTRKVYGILERKYGKDTPFDVECASMWKGKKYLLFYYETYKDVRLVGAPPVKIGAFGGEQDNWGWPQHKGDFALYRVYGDAKGRPAAYAEDNVPITPRKVLNVSTSGIHDGDYAMVIGFPGRTNRYMSSFAVREKEHVTNPVVIKARRDRLDIMLRHMEADPDVRLMYSDKYFNISNYADYAKWENKCLRRFDVVAIREAEEEHLQRWIEADSARKAEDGTLLEELARGYKARQGAERNLNYFREAWLGPSEALLVANRVSSYLGKLERLKQDSLIVDSKDARSVVAGSGRLSRNYDAATDRDLLARMVVNFTANVPREMWGAQLQAMYDKAGGNADRMARAAFDASFCSDPARYDAYFSKNRSVAEIRRDPMVALTESVTVQRFTGGVDKAEKRGRARVGRSESRYADVLYDFRASEGLAQYPNANSTMRLTYGSVQPLNPSDGVHYDSRSTIAGYMEKYNPDEYEYRVDDRMRRLIAKRDWGRWGENDTLYVNFLTDNDITGGNSGSPVLDGKGHLIGLAFDGNRESMAGDVWFHPELARTVCVDIRYVMWVIDKYADAGWLLDEMKFAK